MEFGVLVDVCLGVMAIMILFTLAAAAINEMIADNIMNMRGKSLHDAIVGLLRKYKALGASTLDLDDAIAKFYADPSVQATMEDRSWVKQLLRPLMSVKGGHRPPSAIEPALFAQVVEPILGTNAATIKAKVTAFDQDFKLTMDRVSGWYVRKVKTSLFVIGLILAIGANVDLFRYAEQLAEDDNLRQRIDATVGMINALEASTPSTETPPPDEAPDLEAITQALTEQIGGLNRDLTSAGLTVGWECLEEEQAVPAALPSALAQSVQAWACDGAEGQFLPWPDLPRILCWLIVAFGVTLGAQFWFDLFRSLVNLRTPGKTGGTVEDQSASNTGG